MERLQRIAAVLVCAIGCGGLIGAPVRASGRSDAAPATVLADFLSPAGNLTLPANFVGRLDPGGYVMVQAKGEQLRFAPAPPKSSPNKLFGVPGGCNGYIYAMLVAPSGLIYLGGEFSICEEVQVSQVAAYDPRSRRFYALGSGAGNGVGGNFSTVYALAFAGSDLIVAGQFEQAGGVPAQNIARWNGSTWSAIGPPDSNGIPGISGIVYDIVATGNDIYAAGSFDFAGGLSANRIARWDGTSWSALGSGLGGAGDGYVDALALSGGDLYAGGDFTVAGGVPANRVARWNGSTWSALGSGSSNGTNAPVYSLAASGNTVYVGGDFTAAGGQPANHVARWNGSGWSLLGTPARNGVDGGVYAMLVTAAGLYAAGQFTDIGAQQIRNVAYFDGTAWTGLGSDETNGVNRTVFAIAQSSSDIYVGGYFDEAGGQPANFAARFDGSAWSALGSGIGNGVNNVIEALAVAGNDLYAGGRFTQAGGQVANYIARWNGSVWSPLGIGSANGVNSDVLTLARLGGDLYAGGYFEFAGGEPANLIARWNGNAWSPLGSGLAGNFALVKVITAVGSDLYVGGDFSEAGGQPAFKIARWNGTAWSALGVGAANGVSRGDFIGVQAIAAFGSDLYVGGNFSEAGGQPASGVARWNGSAWFSLGSGAQNGVNNGVNALAVLGNEVYVAGGFSEAGGRPASNIARWNGSNWATLGSGDNNGVNGNVRAMAVSGSDLYVAGTFTLAGGEPANGLARWDGNVWHGLSIDAPPQAVRALAIDAGYVYAGGAGLTQTPLPDLQSKAVTGNVANGASSRTVISRTGTRIAFASDASNLAVGDNNGRSDVYARDPLSGAISRASAAAEAINGGAQESFSDPALSADGARVAYVGSSGQVYANLGTAARIVSRSAGGVPGNGPSGKVQMPGLGALAFFESAATNLLTSADGNGSVSDIYVTDLASGAVTLISRGPNGEPANGPSSAPWASDDGQTIVYSTLATNIVPGAAVLPASVKAGTIQQATMMRGGGFGQSRFYLSRNLGTGALGDGDSINVKVTPDGRFGVFESQATNLIAGDTNGVSDIYRFEISNNAVSKLERVSVSHYGSQGNGASKNASISDDGQFVTFETDASNLIELDRNTTTDILVKWMATGEVLRLSRTVDGQQPNGPSVQPTISGDGSTIVFGSNASNLTPNDSNSAGDVFSVNVRERAPAIVTGPIDEPTLSQYALPAPNPANANCPAGFFSAVVDDGPGTGLIPGVFGVEVMLDDPGTRVLAGGLNFGGLIDSGQVGFAGFNFANAANEPQRLNLRVTGSPASSASASLAVHIRIARRTATTNETVFEVDTAIALANAYVNSIVLPPGFYEATVAPSSGSAGGAPEGQFYFELTTSFVDRPGGGFQGGAVVGGYHATHPFGGVSGFAAFCLATPHSTSIRVSAQPTYGASGAKDLRLRIQDAQQRDLIVVPAG